VTDGHQRATDTHCIAVPKSAPLSRQIRLSCRQVPTDRPSDRPPSDRRRLASRCPFEERYTRTIRDLAILRNTPDDQRESSHRGNAASLIRTTDGRRGEDGARENENETKGHASAIISHRGATARRASEIQEIDREEAIKRFDDGLLHWHSIRRSIGRSVSQERRTFMPSAIRTTSSTGDSLERITQRAVQCLIVVVLVCGGWVPARPASARSRPAVRVRRFTRERFHA